MTSEKHIVLFGDSAFDNRAYVPEGQEVILHLREALPETSIATLVAIDGAVCADCLEQIPSVPPDATDLVVSLGGNDALLNIEMLNFPASSSGFVLDDFRRRIDEFELQYRAMLEAVLTLELTTRVCTIYNANFPDDVAPRARIALMLFNDVILRAAFDNSLTVIDLRRICTEPSDYANPIEPSASGGKKIAVAIAHSVRANQGQTNTAAVHA